MWTSHMLEGSAMVRSASPAGGRGLPRKRTALLIASTLVAALALAGCGAAGGSTSKDAKIDLDSAAVLKAAFDGSSQPPPTTGPAAVPGKTVWILSCLAYEGCQRITNGMTDAAKLLGWTTRVVDTKADPNLTISAMRDAITAGADAIVEIPMDCPVLKSGLLAAKDAGVPVVAYGGLDCDNPVFKGGDPLFAANVQFVGKDWADWYGKLGTSDADVVLAEAMAKGIKQPKIIQVRNDDQALQHEHSQAFEDEIKAKCTGCKVYPLSFTVPQLGGGKGPQIFKSGILAHPDANILYYHGDAWLPAGLQAALSSAKKGQFQVICCGDGGQAGLENIRNGTATAIDAYASRWAGFAVMDTVNRVLAGETPFPSEGGEILYVDKDHNLPAEGDYVTGNYDYESDYKKIWNVG
jgi:ribose transport system substrate-binding protein